MVANLLGTTEAAQSSRQPQSSFRILNGSLMGKVKTDSDIRHTNHHHIFYLLNLHVFIYSLCGDGEVVEDGGKCFGVSSCLHHVGPRDQAWQQAWQQAPWTS